MLTGADAAEGLDPTPLGRAGLKWFTAGTAVGCGEVRVRRALVSPRSAVASRLRDWMIPRRASWTYQVRLDALFGGTRGLDVFFAASFLTNAKRRLGGGICRIKRFELRGTWGGGSSVMFSADRVDLICLHAVLWKLASGGPCLWVQVLPDMTTASSVTPSLTQNGLGCGAPQELEKALSTAGIGALDLGRALEGGWPMGMPSSNGLHDAPDGSGLEFDDELEGFRGDSGDFRLGELEVSRDVISERGCPRVFSAAWLLASP